MNVEQHWKGIQQANKLYYHTNGTKGRDLEPKKYLFRSHDLKIFAKTNLNRAEKS